MALSEDQKAMLRLLAQREAGYEDIASLTGTGVDDVRANVRAALAGLDEGLSEDQRAMLRLLAQREEGYADIASLTGTDVEGVRSRVAGALQELGGAAPRQAEHAPPTSPEPEAAEPEPKPEAAPPKSPEPRRKATVPGPPRLRLPEDEGVRRALMAGAAVLVIVVLLLVTGALGGDDGGSSEAGGNGAGTAASNAGKEPTEAVLEPVAGGQGSGRALFGRSGQNVVLQLEAEGLPDEPQGQSYTVSLVRSAKQRLPVVATETNDSGSIRGSFQIAPEVLGLLASGFDRMELSLVRDGELRKALNQATKSRKAPEYEGRAVLAGPVTGPIVEAGEEGG